VLSLIVARLSLFALVQLLRRTDDQSSNFIVFEGATAGQSTGIDEA